MIKIIFDDINNVIELNEIIFGFFKDYEYTKNSELIIENKDSDEPIIEYKLFWGGLEDTCSFTENYLKIETIGNKEHIIFIIEQLITDLCNFTKIGLHIDVGSDTNNKDYIFAELTKRGKIDKNKNGEDIAFYCEYYEDSIKIFKGKKEEPDERIITIKQYKFKILLKDYKKKIESVVNISEFLGLILGILSIFTALYSDIDNFLKFIIAFVLIITIGYLVYRLYIKLKYKGDIKENPNEEVERIMEKYFNNEL